MKTKNIKMLSAFFSTVLLFIWIINISFECVFENKRIENIEDVMYKEKIASGSNFAIMIEQNDGSYTESSSVKWPENYKLNIEKSKCIDQNGNILNDILTYNNGVVQAKTTTTSYCYLYFDELIDTEKLIENVSSDVLWNSTLEDDGYRYVGPNPDNYICFGTIDTSTCTENADLYMYRIIGIFEDSDGEQHLKLIKKEALNESYMWEDDFGYNHDWDASDLYKGLNGVSGGYYSNLFVGSTTYSYMSTNGSWYNKIEDWEYTATNTKTYENLGTDYYNDITVENIYLHEIDRSNKTSTVGEWKTVKSKIGLTYVSDYLLSLGSSALEYTSYDNRMTLKTGWMHLSNNDNRTSSREWTLTRYGDEYGDHFAWVVSSDGSVDSVYVDYLSSIRPVFYLIRNIKMTGRGTKSNPYIIAN